MINIINFINILDTSILNILDSKDFPINNNGKLVLDLNKINCDELEFYILSNLNNKKIYNSTNIVINTCYPKDNWRLYKGEENKIDNYKWQILDKQIHINLSNFEGFINKQWKKLKKEEKLKNSFIFIEDKKIDSIDFITLFEKYCYIKQSYQYKNTFIIQDNNINLYKKKNKNIPEYILTRFERIGRNYKLII